METAHDGKETLTAVNNIMRHTNHNDVDLVLRAGDNVLARVNFAEHIAKYGIDTSLNECVIPFKISFLSGKVSVTVPDWYIHEVKPEWRQNNK
jgi:hypothetical protein